MGPPVLSTDGGSCPSNPPAVCRSKLAKSTIELRKPFASVTMKEEPFNFLRTLCGSQDDARFKTELENFYTGCNDISIELLMWVDPHEELDVGGIEKLVASICTRLIDHRCDLSLYQLTPEKHYEEFDDGVVAGATAGVVVETVLYPIDTIKTRLQAGCSSWKQNSLERLIFRIGWQPGRGFTVSLESVDLDCVSQGSGVAPALTARAHRSCIPNKFIKEILHSASYCTVYLSSPTPPLASAIFVGIYEPTKQQLVKMFPENLSAVAHLTAGAIGGLAASLIRVPTEVVKQRMQTGQFTSAPNAVRLIAAKEGIRGLYAGYNSFLLRDLPFDAIQFCIYEQLRIGYKIAARRELNDPENALIGAFAGAITGAVTTPLDVMKTRLMVQGSASQYKGLINCAQTILKEEGPAAFLKSKYYNLISDVEMVLNLDNINRHWTKSIMDWHRRLNLLWRSGEDKTVAFPETFRSENQILAVYIAAYCWSFPATASQR
ncbi:hypothetical protein ZIOFF_048819 [Zingiber officinale]|uniref:Mitochondrial carrier protein n=1 Tax=Zingiber officinale TaxID=94328 RepID=A0A8J5KN08_ZINOF|nr:hypothetical protein ZIOFF_048819 [Zingiber officinale]